MEREKLLTAQEVAEYLRVHVVTVRKWLESGQLNGIKLRGKAGWRIREAEMERFLAEQETGRSS